GARIQAIIAAPLADDAASQDPDRGDASALPDRRRRMARRRPAPRAPAPRLRLRGRPAPLPVGPAPRSHALLARLAAAGPDPRGRPSDRPLDRHPLPVLR